MSALRFTKGIQSFSTGSFDVAVLPRYGSGVVCISGAIEAGPWHAAPGKEPVAEILASLLDEGTKHRGREEFRTSLEMRGTSLNFWANGRYVMFSLLTTTHAVKDAVDLMFEALTEPALDEQARIQVIEREAATRIHDAEDTRLSARHALSRQLLKAESSGYRVDPLTERASTLSISADDVRTFFQTAFSGTVRIAVVGDIRPDDMEKILLNAGQMWKIDNRSTARSMIPNDSNSGIRKEFVSIPGKESVDVFVGAYVPLAPTDPKTPALLAAVDLLGGGFSDHLMQTVRDRDGLTYGTVARMRGRESGTGFYWFAWAMFGNTLFDKGMHTLQNEISVFLNAGIKEERFREKIAETEGRLAVSFSSHVSAVSEILSGMLVSNNPSDADSYVAALKSIDAKLVETVAQTYMPISALSAAGAIDSSGRLL